MMPTHTIRLPNGRSVAVAEYVRSWRILRQMEPDNRVAGFGHFPMPASEILRDLRYGMHDRINLRDQRFEKGRKWHHDWQRAMRHAQWQVNTPRLIIDWLPPDLEPRFSHRLRRNRCDL